MPIGASRLNTLARYVAPVGGGLAAYSSTLSIDSYADLGFSHYRTAYMGTTTGGDPIFAHVYKYNVGGGIQAVAFSIDLSTGTVTTGTPVAFGYAGYQTPSIISENMHAGRDDSVSNYGWVNYYQGGYIRNHVIQVDTSTLALSTGSTYSISGTDSGSTGLTYLGYDTTNSRYLYGTIYRISGGDRRIQLMYRSASSPTALGSYDTMIEPTSGATDMAVGFAIDGTNNRCHMTWLADYSGLAGSEGAVFAGPDTNFSTGAYDYITRAELFGGRSTTTSETAAVPLAIQNKALGFQYNSTDTDIRAQVIQTNRSTGTPTATIGSYITLSGGSSGVRGFSAGVADDEAYYVYNSGGNIAWRQITASGTTLTEGSENTTSVSTTNMTGSTVFCPYSDATYGDWLVGVIDDSSSTDPKIVAIQVAT